MARPRKSIAIPAEELPLRDSFTVPEVAALTGYHVRTIQARLRDGTLQGKKLGGVWRIYRESIVESAPYVKVGTDLNIEEGVQK